MVHSATSVHQRFTQQRTGAPPMITGKKSKVQLGPALQSRKGIQPLRSFTAQFAMRKNAMRDMVKSSKVRRINCWLVASTRF